MAEDLAALLDAYDKLRAKYDRLFLDHHVTAKHTPRMANLTAKTLHHNDIAAELRKTLVYIGVDVRQVSVEAGNVIYDMSRHHAPAHAWELPRIRRAFLGWWFWSAEGYG